MLIAQYREDNSQDNKQKDKKGDFNNCNSAIHGVLALLDRLLDAAKALERLDSAIEILILKALAHEANNNISTALVPLKQALSLAEPEGYVRRFVDEGAPMAAMLQVIGEQPSDYVNQLRLAFGQIEDKTSVAGQIEDKRPVAQKLTEPLSDRELEVLQLLKTVLTGPEIARELMVSLNTLRTHTKNIYTKLEVSNRRAAVQRAEELDLL